jgi:beta-galactosidase
MDTPLRVRLPGVLHGGDYNPEQWPESIWDDDIALMRRAHVTVATLPVFGWVTLQPAEDTFAFDWLDRILDKLAATGIHACLATATASQPAWLDAAYPDVLVTDDTGVRRRHGNRHSFCPSSANFRRLSTGLARRLAERYKDHPALLLWHVSNEYGTYCYCENCAAAFRAWLAARYGDLATLNARWNTVFWGHTFTDWDQIEPPVRNGEGAVQALRIDWSRFQTESLLECYRAEAAELRAVTPEIPITTNFMGAFFPLDYRRWAAHLDIVAWDCYPQQGDPPAHVAFSHTLMRGLKEGQPFLLMEQSPSQQNWQPYNTIKPPQGLRLQSFQAIAHGANSVMYFQWRRSRGGIEKLHGAVIEHHANPETRVFQEVAALGADLARLGTRTLEGRTPARVAVLFDWENWWALSASSGPSRDLDYLQVCRAFYAALHGLGIATDIVAPDADLTRYDLIAAPLLSLLTAKNAARLDARVQAGATLLATTFTALVDDSDLVHDGGAPGPLRETLGLWVEETDAVMPGETQGLRFDDGTCVAARLLCDRVHPTTARTIATYTDDFYAGEAAFTRNVRGDGQAYYLATLPDDAGLKTVLSRLCAERGIGSPLADGAPPPEGIEVAERVAPDGTRVLYLLNHGSTSVSVTVPAGTTDLLTGDDLATTVELEPLGVRVLVRKETTQ